MGLLEKFKNAFFEEEYVEVEEKPPVKKETVIPKKKNDAVIEDPVIDFKKEMQEMNKVAHNASSNESNNELENNENKVENISDTKNNKDVKFNYFDDTDFLDIDDNYTQEKSPKKIYEQKEERAKPYSNTNYSTQGYSRDLYANKSHENDKIYSATREKAVFKPTPIISPIYGILDTNYTKDDIPDKKEIKPTSSYVSRKNADLDYIRQKAFGAMDADFGLNGDDKVKEEEIHDTFEEDNLLYDMTNVDKTPSVDKVTLQDAEDYYKDLGLEYNVDYKDAKMERKTGRRVSRTPVIDEIEEEGSNLEDDKYEDIDLEIPNDNEVDTTSDTVSNNADGNNDINNFDDDNDNLFDLIDSMYDGKE